jgi:hypothetical protein
MSRLFLGPIKNPTWKDFFIRVGGVLAVIVVVIFAAQEFIPGREGIAIIVASLVLIAFVGIQEVRHNMLKKKPKQGRPTK